MKQTFIQPVKGKINSPFGPRIAPIAGASTIHNGVDIPAPTGMPIRAPLDGKILSIYSSGTGGNQLIVEHTGNWRTGYAHLSAYGTFKIGQKFKQGDIIGYVGATGNVSGPHVHFTLTNPNGIKVDPEKYFGKNLA